MELSIQATARLLNVPEKQIRTWIQESALPHYTVQDHLLFNQDEIIDWAAKHHVTVRLPEADGRNRPGGGPWLYESLSRGGIFHDLPGNSLSEVFRELLARLPLVAGTDRELLVQMMAAREKAHSTGLGDGIAIPHVQSPVILPMAQPIAALAFLRQPLDWKAPDGKLVFCLFTLVCPTIFDHLALLARIANSLQDELCKTRLQTRASATDLLAAYQALESRLQDAGEAKD